MLYLPWLSWAMGHNETFSNCVNSHRYPSMLYILYLPQLPWQCDTIKTVSNCAMPLLVSMASIACTVTVVVHAVCLRFLGNATQLRLSQIGQPRYPQQVLHVLRQWLYMLHDQLLGNFTQFTQFLILSSHTGIYSKLACTVTMPYLPLLPRQSNTIKKVSNFVMSPKVAMVSWHLQ